MVRVRILLSEPTNGFASLVRVRTLLSEPTSCFASLVRVSTLLSEPTSGVASLVRVRTLLSEPNSGVASLLRHRAKAVLTKPFFQQHLHVCKLRATTNAGAFFARLGILLNERLS